MKTNKLFKIDSPPLAGGVRGGGLLCIGQSLVEYAVILACFIIYCSISFMAGALANLNAQHD